MNEPRLDRAARICPRCGGDSYVYYGSERDDGVYVRRRVCKDCGTKFDTLEIFSGYMKKDSDTKAK